jgi:hypothetical protein
MNRPRMCGVLAGLAGLAVSTGRTIGEPAAGGESALSSSVIISAPITHSDWMLGNPGPAWGAAGVHQVLDRCRQAGLAAVYWRCFDGGRACYASRLMDPLHGFDDDNYHRGRDTEALVARLKQWDWGRFDSFAEALRYGRRIGLKVHAWLTINEDDHGWGLTSRFAREHLESRWVRRDGRPFRSQQSFAFVAVRDYKLGLLEEVLAYEPDGVLLDWIRTGDVRDNPQTDADGVAIHGYERPNVEQFRDSFHADPTAVPNGDERWVRIRAEPQTGFMRRARELIRRKCPGAVVTALVQHPWGYRGGPDDTRYRDNLHGLLIDLRTWGNEGLVDEVVAAGYYRAGGTSETAWRALREETGGKARVLLFGWIATPEQFAADTKLARRLGAPGLLLWEADYLKLPPANAPLIDAMARFAGRAGPASAPAGARP